MFYFIYYTTKLVYLLKSYKQIDVAMIFTIWKWWILTNNDHVQWDFEIFIEFLTSYTMRIHVCINILSNLHQLNFFFYDWLVHRFFWDYFLNMLRNTHILLHYVYCLYLDAVLLNQKHKLTIIWCWMLLIIFVSGLQVISCAFYML